MSLATLPNELLLMIAGNLGPASLLSLMLCCKYFHAFSSDTLKTHAITSPYFKTAALFWATITRNEEMLQLLLTVGTPIKTIEIASNRPNGVVTRHSVPSPCAPGTVLHMLMRGSRLQLNSILTIGGTLPALSWAVHNNHIGLLKLAINRGADSEWRDARECTALHTALQIGNKPMALLLLSSGASIDAADITNCRALETAAKRCGDLVDVILRLGANPNWSDIRGATALHFAAREGNVSAAKHLLRYHADPNAIDRNLMTPLHRAAKHKNSTSTVQMLLDHGADVTMLNNRSQNPFQLAEDSGNPAVGILLEKLYHIVPRWSPSMGRSYLHLAVRHSQPWLIKEQLVTGADVNARDRSGKTALHYAASIGSGDIISMLIDAGGSVDAIDDTGKSVLHITAKIPGLALFWELLVLSEAASFSLRDTIEECTPLHLAARTMVDPEGAYSRCDGAERNRLWDAITAKERVLFAEVMEKRRMD